MWQTAVPEGEDTELIPTASWQSSSGAEQGMEVVTERDSGLRRCSGESHHPS